LAIGGKKPDARGENDIQWAEYYGNCSGVVAQAMLDGSPQLSKKMD